MVLECFLELPADRIRRAQTELCSLPPKKHQIPNGEALALEAGASAPGANSARRLPDVQKCPPPASEPARVARSAVAASHPWPHPPSIKTLGHIGSGRGLFTYGFIPPSTATSSARQLIAAACSANLRHVCAILIRTVLSEALGALRANRRHSMAFCR